MGLFGGGDKGKGKSDTLKKAKQKKKTLEIDSQINDLQIKKAELEDGGGGGLFGGGSGGSSGELGWHNWWELEK